MQTTRRSETTYDGSVKSASKVGRRPGESDTRGDILKATRECLNELGFEKTTVRKIAARAQVSESLVIHQFGSKDKLIAEALTEPESLDTLINLMRKFPRAMWGRVVAEIFTRATPREHDGRDYLELLMRASISSPESGRLVTDWVANTIAPEFERIGLTFPLLRARALASLMFGSTYVNRILNLGELTPAERKAQLKIDARVLQAVLGDKL